MQMPPTRRLPHPNGFEQSSVKFCGNSSLPGCRLPDLAADLVRRKVAVIFTTGSVVSAIAAKSATSTIPIVFANGSDPVRYGLVASLNRPGSNVTGVSFYNSGLGPKRIELLREIVPGASLIAVLVNPKNPNAEPDLQEIVKGGRHRRADRDRECQQ